MARRYEIDLLTATILVRRGHHHAGGGPLHPADDPSGLHNPFLMPSMADAVERINAAIDSGEKILIFGDRDVDGITSTVLLFEALQELGAEVQWMLPEGEDPRTGSRRACIERAVADGVGLLLTVDCGVSNNAEIERCRVAGHRDRGHRPSQSACRNSRRQSAVVDPKLPGYPFRDLCGCAVASKVEWALRFSRSPFFGAPICLLNARPANETIVVEAVRLTNLVETERITESFVPGLVAFEKTRLAGFISGEEVAGHGGPGAGAAAGEGIRTGDGHFAFRPCTAGRPVPPRPCRQEPPQDPAVLAKRRVHRRVP